MDLRDVGEIYDPCEQKYVEWKIENYLSSICQKADTRVESPIFHFLNSSWRLIIYPNGLRSEDSVGWFGLHLSMEDSEDILVDFTLGINGLLEDAEKSSVHSFQEDDKISGWDAFLERSRLIRKTTLFIPEGDLTVFCRAKLFRARNSARDSATQTKDFDGVYTLSRDFQRLLVSEEKSDFAIKVKTRLFRAHKLVLASRSPVFSAMFEHDMQENSSGTLNIVDYEPEAFSDFLTYMYTGRIEMLSTGNVTDLFCLADKYDVKDLRSICLAFMKENLSLGTICAVVAIADQHNEAELKKSAIDLIKNNIKTLIPTDQWISFMADKPSLAAEILMNSI